ncbi:DHS-like NAD/FAD-binding domain-containing protein [Obba rivulosa]|uniref:DHS-like NAD/FAD-binding domain-containing protein n=1 Tax=Obba rivulosa TaxID=1052685 RepID=A0A8E2DRD2_9APHY|nr:DHS-like NAD/FAD-binding domain-containing protein [Obba rivulosa]
MHALNTGIPTFRGAGGMWRKYDAMSLATPEAFHDNPSRVWQFYHYRREKALNAQPNPAHLALAAFSLPSIRHRVAPESSFTLVTQNVDGLSQRALDSTLAAKPEFTEEIQTADQPIILEMHGRLFDVVCTARTCRHRELNFSSPVCAALQGTETLVEQGVIEPDVPLDDLPRCSKCGALTRPGVVWFGEQPQHMDAITELVDKADLCLVVGTSSTVYPAAGFAYQVKENGGKVAVFNLDRSEGDHMADFLFLGPCEETLPKALGLNK